MLQASDPGTIESLRARLAQSRHDGDEAFAAAAAALDRDAPGDLAVPRARMEARLAAIRRLRPAIDAAVALPGRGATDTERALGRRAGGADDGGRCVVGPRGRPLHQHRPDRDAAPVVQAPVAHRHRTWRGASVRWSVRRSSEDARLAPAELAELQRGQGVVMEDWRIARTLAEQSGLSPPSAAPSATPTAITPPPTT